MTQPLVPSVKSGAEPLPAGSEACGCCDGVDVATPQAIDNRGGLSEVRYRIGTHGQWRASLEAGLSLGAFAPMTGLLTRDQSDFSIGLIDAFACAADVLTFYQERIANESWLRTATERVSLQEQARLIGYRMQPGVAAEAWLAFATETPPAPPPTLKPEPGAFVTGVPDVVVLDAGLRVNSVPGPGEKPQAFETDEALEARWRWNAMPALPDADLAPGLGAVETWLAGTSTQLKPGDVLAFVGAAFVASPTTSDRWDVRVLTAVEPDDGRQRTRVAWTQPLAQVATVAHPSPAPQVLAMRERAAVFGHNAPDWHSMSAEFKAAYLGLTDPSQLLPEHLVEWPNFDIFAPGGTGPSAVAHASALDAAAALQETLGGAALQQARIGALAAGQVVAGGAQFMQRMAQLPGEAAAGWLNVIRGVPEIFDAVMAPVAGAAQATADVAASSVEALNQLKTAVTGLRTSLRVNRG